MVLSFKNNPFQDNFKNVEALSGAHIYFNDINIISKTSTNKSWSCTRGKVGSFNIICTGFYWKRQLVFVFLLTNYLKKKEPFDFRDFSHFCIFFVLMVQTLQKSSNRENTSVSSNSLPKGAQKQKVQVWRVNLKFLVAPQQCTCVLHHCTMV